MNLYELTPLEAGEKIKSKEIGVRELTMAALERIETIDDDVQAFLRTEADAALAQADAVQKKIDNSELTGP